MLIEDLLKSGHNVTISVSLKDLQEWHKSVIAETKKELEDIVLSDKAETYPSPKQVSEILGVTTMTLGRWAKSNYLVPIEIGGKRKYKMSEVKALLNKKS